DGGGRPRHAGRSDRRRLPGQRRQELADGGGAGVLAVLPGCAVHRGDAVPARRHRRPGAAPAARREEAGARRRRRSARRGQGMTPDLMDAGAARYAMHHGQPPTGRTESGGREAGYGRPAVPGEVDVTHGRILYLEDVSVSFDGFKAINRLSLDIAPGELRCIIGPNGAGKTTMMDIITG